MKKLNDKERERWIRNNSVLFCSWYSSKLSMKQYLKKRREDIDTFIKAKLPNVC